MAPYLVWIIVAMALLGAEMMLGTIYLLAFVAGAAAACTVSFMTESFATQLSVAAVVSIAGVILALIFRRKLRKNLTPNQECDNLDEGKTVSVTKVEADGTARVNYRGAQWTATAHEGILEIGQYHILKVDGTRLILTK